MKKLLLSLALLGGAVMAGNAQTLQFLDEEGNPIANGATFTYEGMEQFGNMIIVDPGLSIMSTEDDLITVQSTRIQGGTYQLCAGGDCVTSKPEDNPVITKNNIDVNEGKIIPLNMEAILQDITIEEVPYYEILLEAWSEIDPENKTSITVKMGDLEKAAVKSIQANGNEINVIGKVLNYNVNSSASLNIYSLSGKTVASRNIAGSGSLNLGNLPKGVYIYKVSGKNAKSGKFIIR